MLSFKKKGKQNGKYCYHQPETWVKVYTRNLRMLLMRFHKALPIVGESISEVSHFIPEPRNFVEVTRLLEDIKIPWLKSTLKEIEHLFKNQTF